MKQLFFTTALIGCFGLCSVAQDAKFSQYENAPLLLNPAMTGKFTGKIRFGILGSHQRSEPATLNHISGFADYKLKGKKGSYGVGVSYYQNGHGDFALTGNFLGLSGARHLELGPAGKHVLSLGVQATFAHGKLDVSKPYYDMYLSGGGFSDLKAESASGTTNYADLAAGVLYTFNTENLVLETGFSFYHLFKPDNSIDTVSTKLGRRGAFTVNAAINLHPMTKMYLTSLMWKEGLNWKAAPPKVRHEIYTMYGITLESQNTQNNTVIYGVGTRSLNTFLVKGGYAIKKKVRLLASYERPIQDDTYSVRRGELSALFTL